MHLLAGCGQWLHNACQHTLPGSGTSEGCQSPGPTAAVWVQSAATAPAPALLHPHHLCPCTPHSPHAGPGPALLQGVLLGCRWTGCTMRVLLGLLLWDGCSLMRGTWFPFRDVTPSHNLAEGSGCFSFSLRSLSSAPGNLGLTLLPACFCLLSLSIPADEMPLLTKPNQTGRYMTITPAASRTQRGPSSATQRTEQS